MVNTNSLVDNKLIRYIFYLINCTIFVLLLLPALPVIIRIWWLDNLLNLQIQWSIVALFLILINAFFIKKLRLLAAVLFIATIFYNLMPLYYPLLNLKLEGKNVHQIENQETIFTIAQLNLNYDNPNLKQILPILGDNKFALLVLQEASDKEYKNISQLAHYYPYSLGIGPSESTPSGLAIFSRYPISEKHIHDLGYKRGHVLEIVIQVPNSSEPIQVYALHPTSPRSEILWQLRNLALAAIAEKVAASPFTNKLVIGDFNSSPWSSAFRSFQQTSQLKNSALGFGYIPSWSYSTRPLLSILSSVYIDHSLISNPFKVLNKHAQSIQGTDHLMLLTELVI